MFAAFAKNIEEGNNIDGPNKAIPSTTKTFQKIGLHLHQPPYLSN
jgi:hypothetical protein